MGGTTEATNHPRCIYFLPTVHHRPFGRSTASTNVVGLDEDEEKVGGGDEKDEVGEEEDEVPYDALVVCGTWQVRQWLMIGHSYCTHSIDYDYIFPKQAIYLHISYVIKIFVLTFEHNESPINTY